MTAASARRTFLTLHAVMGLVGVLYWLSTDVAAQKPVREEEAIVDGELPPESPADMIRAADAVIVGTYTGRNRLLERSSSEGLEFTYYSFVISEVLKFDPLAAVIGDELELRMIGGERELATHIRRIRVRYTEPLRPKHSYVVFLRRNPVRNQLEPAWGAASLYDITQGIVRGVERQRQHRDGEPAPAFLNALRASVQ